MNVETKQNIYLNVKANITFHKTIITLHILNTQQGTSFKIHGVMHVISETKLRTILIHL